MSWLINRKDARRLTELLREMNVQLPRTAQELREQARKLAPEIKRAITLGTR